MDKTDRIYNLIKHRNQGQVLLRASAVRDKTIYWAPAVDNIADYLNYR